MTETVPVNLQRLTQSIAEMNKTIAKDAARHVAQQVTRNPWFHNRPDRIQELVENVLIASHQHMCGNN